MHLCYCMCGGWSVKLAKKNNTKATRYEIKFSDHPNNTFIPPRHNRNSTFTLQIHNFDHRVRNWLSVMILKQRLLL